LVLFPWYRFPPFPLVTLPSLNLFLFSFFSHGFFPPFLFFPGPLSFALIYSVFCFSSRLRPKARHFPYAHCHSPWRVFPVFVPACPPSPSIPLVDVYRLVRSSAQPVPFPSPASSGSFFFLTPPLFLRVYPTHWLISGFIFGPFFQEVLLLFPFPPGWCLPAFSGSSGGPLWWFPLSLDYGSFFPPFTSLSPRALGDTLLFSGRTKASFFVLRQVELSFF